MSEKSSEFKPGDLVCTIEDEIDCGYVIRAGSGVLLTQPLTASGEHWKASGFVEGCSMKRSLVLTTSNLHRGY